MHVCVVTTAVGGAQAIAAFAYGIPGKIPSCDAIVGPGTSNHPTPSQHRLVSNTSEALVQATSS
jgi:histidinol dehydrogenase